jgi:hypothetical protein
MPAPRFALPPHLGWPHWLGALLFGLMLVLLVLILSWLLTAAPAWALAVIAAQGSAGSLIVRVPLHLELHRIWTTNTT